MHSGACYLLRLSNNLPYLRFLSSKKTVILLYHSVPRQGNGELIDAAVFEQHIVTLEKEFRIIPHTELHIRRITREPRRVLLTFDDGFRNHAEVVAPILKRHNVPATFFVCSRSAQPRKYLWFSYIRALENHFQGNGFSFRSMFVDMSRNSRRASIQQLQDILLKLLPHPLAMYEAIENELPRLEDFVTEERLADGYAGMTAEQLRDLSGDPLFSIGAHTLDHPFLSRCERAEARRPLLENKRWIEDITGRSCEAIAYPSGDYDADVLTDCEQIGLKDGYAVIPRVGTHTDFELPRVGIYSTSLEILRFKAQWGNLIRALGLSLG